MSVTALLVPAHVEFHRITSDYITVATAEALHVEELAAAYKAAIEVEQTLVNRENSIPYTKDLEELDKLRDDCLTELFTSVKITLKSPLENRSRAADTLHSITRRYDGIQNMAREKETNMIRGLLENLKAEDAIDALTALGLTTIVTQLRQANNSYIATQKMREEAEAEQADIRSLSTYEQRAIVDNLYRQIVERVNAFAIAVPSAELDKFIDLMNAHVGEAKRAIAHMRAGGSGNEKRKKKSDEETPEDDGTEPEETPEEAAASPEEE